MFKYPINKLFILYITFYLNFNKNIDMTFGVNNILDATYIRSNTYKDLTLVVADTSEVMLLNEPGRYIYTSFDFRF